MNRDRKQIEELAQLLEGRVPADDADAPLRRLASLATAVAEHSPVPEIDPAARARLRTDVVAAAASADVTWLDRARDAVDARTAQVRYSMRTAAATATASTMLGTVGVAAASQAALPGDVLYSVKQGTESVRLWLADGLAESGRLHLAFARERLEEIESGVHRLDADTVIATLDEMDEESVLGANDLLTLYDGTGDHAVLDDLSEFTDAQTDRLSTVAPLLPVEARSFVERSLEVLRRIDVQVATVSDACPVCGTEPAVSSAPLPPPPAVTAPDDGPAITDRPCDCVVPEQPAPPRDPEPQPQPPPPSTPPEPQPEPEPEPEPDDDDDDDIPELPGPLDPIGDEVDDVIDELEDTVDDVLPPAPSTDDSLIDGTVDSTSASTADVIDDSTDDVTAEVNDDVTAEANDDVNDDGNDGTPTATAEDTTGTSGDELSEPSPLP